MRKYSARILLAAVCLLVVISGPQPGWATNFNHGPYNSFQPNGFIHPGFFFNQPTVAVAVPSVRTVVAPAARARYISTSSHLVGQPASWNIPVSSPGMTGSSLRTDFSWQSSCPSSNPNFDKQLQAYVSGIEALTGNIMELDEAVTQMKSTPKSCEGSNDQSDRAIHVEPVGRTTSLESQPLAAPVNVEVAVTTESVSVATESFTDPPSFSTWRRRRDSAHEGSVPFGTPSTASSTPTGSPPMPADQANDDLAKASNDLKALRKDLSRAAEWLKQTNHTVHSAMLRALQAYVTSIERRVDNQRQLYAQTRGTLLKTKIVAIKEKVASLMDKLKSLIPLRHNDNNLAREGTGSSPAPIASTVATLIIS